MNSSLRLPGSQHTHKNTTQLGRNCKNIDSILEKNRKEIVKSAYLGKMGKHVSRKLKFAQGRVSKTLPRFETCESIPPLTFDNVPNPVKNCLHEMIKEPGSENYDPNKILDHLISVSLMFFSG